MMRNALCGVFVRIAMAEEETQRASTKRQIARLIGNASVPIYILDNDFRILFANDALVQLCGVELNSLIGLDCSNNMPLDTSRLSIVAATLALPPNSDRTVVDIHQLVVPGDVTHWVCISFPLDRSSHPMTLCAIKEDRGDRDALLATGHQSRLKLQLIDLNGDPSPPKEHLWFLRGSSASAIRTLNQMEAASTDLSGVHVTGTASSASLAVAKWIAWKRRVIASDKTPKSPKAGVIVVECQLMDRSLLRGTLEMIDEQSRIQSKSHGPVTAILHKIDKLPGSLVEPMIRWRPLPNVSLLATSCSPDLIALYPDNSGWGELASNFETHVVQVPSLAQRVADIEALVVAWLELEWKRQEGSDKFRWTQEFIDAMLAYSWPGDIAEFDAVMRDAAQRCQGHLLSDNDLPSSLRTFPSHVQRPEPLAKIDLDSVLAQIEREIIQQAMAQFPRNRTATANQLGISRARLLRRLQQLGLEKADAASQANSEEPIFEEWTDEFPGERDAPEKQ
jgi:DNA-binding protein Fis